MISYLLCHVSWLEVSYRFYSNERLLRLEHEVNLGCIGHWKTKLNWTKVMPSGPLNKTLVWLVIEYKVSVIYYPRCQAYNKYYLEICIKGKTEGRIWNETWEETSVGINWVNRNKDQMQRVKWFDCRWGKEVVTKDISGTTYNM